MRIYSYSILETIVPPFNHTKWRSFTMMKGREGLYHGVMRIESGHLGFIVYRRLTNQKNGESHGKEEGI